MVWTILSMRPCFSGVYNELASKCDFRVIFVTADEDEESLNGNFSKMPWVAVPFSDSEICDRSDELFKISGILYHLIIGENGKVLSDCGVEIIGEYGVEVYPFITERIKELKDQEEAAKMGTVLEINLFLVKTLRSILVSPDGKKVSVSELQEKRVGPYLSYSSYKLCVEFTPKLVEVYEKLKGKGKSLEIVHLMMMKNHLS